MTPFEIYFLIVPVAIVAFGVAVYFLTGWQDRREERRKAR
jgi:hypothetical protein